MAFANLDLLFENSIILEHTKNDENQDFVFRAINPDGDEITIIHQNNFDHIKIVSKDGYVLDLKGDGNQLKAYVNGVFYNSISYDELEFFDNQDYVQVLGQESVFVEDL